MFKAIDFDNVWYPYTKDFKMENDLAYAVAACSLDPDLTLGTCIELARESFATNGDSITVFAEEYNIDRLTMHRVAHRIMDKKGWATQDGISEAFMKLKQHGDAVIWTHGCSLSIPNSASLIGAYGVINPKDVYDMNTLGRKDSGLEPYEKLAEIRGQKDNHNKILIDDNVSNLKQAKEAGWHTAHVYWDDKYKTDAPYIDISAKTGVQAFNKVAELEESLMSRVVYFKKKESSKVAPSMSRANSGSKRPHL